MYRRGIFELPSVDNYMDLLKGNGSPFVNGAIVYAKDRDEILVSKGGEWHAIVTEPISRMPRREMGQPRKDGQPAIFGPRMPTPRGTDQMSKAWIV
jgi:hypothetical protein